MRERSHHGHEGTTEWVSGASTGRTPSEHPTWTSSSKHPPWAEHPTTERRTAKERMIVKRVIKVCGAPGEPRPAGISKEGVEQLEGVCKMELEWAGTTAGEEWVCVEWGGTREWEWERATVSVVRT